MKCNRTGWRKLVRTGMRNKLFIFYGPTFKFTICKYWLYDSLTNMTDLLYILLVPWILYIQGSSNCQPVGNEVQSGQLENPWQLENPK